MRMPPVVAALLTAFVSITVVDVAHAQGLKADDARRDRFRQLDEVWPTPNDRRTASGAPGHKYWQQRADYDIKVVLDEDKKLLTGDETVTYHNNSPDTLTYLWLQLDDNWLHKTSAGQVTRTAPDFNHYGFDDFGADLELERFDGRVKLTKVKMGKRALRHQVVGTMMRIDLDKPLKPGQKMTFSIGWKVNLLNAKVFPFRQGYEVLEDGNALFEVAHFYPRMAAYTDVTGWQHKQFLGRGEFTVDFGNYKLSITAPADHVVTATGVLQNPSAVLSAKQRQRLATAKRAKKPVFVVTKDEAKTTIEKNAARVNAKKPYKKTKTWVFSSKNVRDVAFASSRTFVWDAMGHKNAGKPVMAMSFYPQEAMPLWDHYSTQSIIHTLDVYSRYTFQYPYPVAISVNGPVGGMEYPMICFNGPRPSKDGTYYDTFGEGKKWRESKYGLISVIIHEVGHNYFPMIVNSDERQWTWMDEGLNTFLQYLAEKEWEDDYPSWRGEPKKIINYMKSRDQVPIMTGSDSILQFGNNAYGKPATALNILRETVMGPELFDFAFKEYAQRWKFKRPYPADFFRSMEDASGMDLDWFWRGWFYTTDPVDIAITNLRLYEVDTQNPEVEKPLQKKLHDEEPAYISKDRDKALPKRVNRYPYLKDFYNAYDKYAVTDADRENYQKFVEGLDKSRERPLLDEHKLFYVVDFENQGGLVMPILLEIHYKDGTKEELRIPAQIWRRNPKKVSKLLMVDQEIVHLVLDPHIETADIDLSDNEWPKKPKSSRFKLFKQKLQPNAMQQAEEMKKKKEDAQKNGASGKGKGKGKGKDKGKGKGKNVKKGKTSK